MPGQGILLTFRSTHDALSAEAALREARIPAETIPKPRVVKADCGLALLVASQHRARVEALLQEGRVPVSGIYDYARGIRSPGSG